MGVTTPTAAELAAKQAITEVIHRYCRSMDRMDRELALSCWHPGGTDDHAPLYAGPAEGFIDWVWGIHADLVSTRHVVTNTLIEVEGDRAWSETYWTVTLRARDGDGLVDIIGGGRYLDHLECIGGVWAFRNHCSVHDWDRVEPVRGVMDAGSITPNNPEAPVRVAARDRGDPSYAFIGRMNLG